MNQCKNSGICSINDDFKAYCTCTSDWLGKVCDIPLADLNKLLAQFDNEINSLNSSTN